MSIDALYNLRKTLREMERDFGLAELTDLERAILEYAAYCTKHGRRIISADIECAEDFKDNSRASIFRALKSLREKGKIRYEPHEKDKRLSYIVPAL